MIACDQYQQCVRASARGCMPVHTTIGPAHLTHISSILIGPLTRKLFIVVKGLGPAQMPSSTVTTTGFVYL